MAADLVGLRRALRVLLGRGGAQEAAGGCEGVRLLECGRVQGALWKSERRHRASSCRITRVLVAQKVPSLSLPLPLTLSLLLDAKLRIYTGERQPRAPGYTGLQRSATLGASWFLVWTDHHGSRTYYHFPLPKRRKEWNLDRRKPLIINAPRTRRTMACQSPRCLHVHAGGEHGSRT